jgi:hypothetical protein
MGVSHESKRKVPCMILKTERICSQAWGFAWTRFCRAGGIRPKAEFRLSIKIKNMSGLSP